MPPTYEMSLRGAFANEAAAAYTTFTDEELQRFCHTIAFLWGKSASVLRGEHPHHRRVLGVIPEQPGIPGGESTPSPDARYFRDALGARAVPQRSGEFPHQCSDAVLQKRHRRRRRRIEPHGNDLRPAFSRTPACYATLRSQGRTAQREGRRAAIRLEKRKRWTPREQGRRSAFARVTHGNAKNHREHTSVPAVRRPPLTNTCEGG